MIHVALIVGSYFLFFSVILAIIFAFVVLIDPILHKELYDHLSDCVEKGNCNITDNKIHILRERMIWHLVKDRGTLVFSLVYFLNIFLILIFEFPYTAIKNFAK
jgi:hypothetical protein